MGAVIVAIILIVYTIFVVQTESWAEDQNKYVFMTYFIVVIILPVYFFYDVMDLLMELADYIDN